MVCSSNANKYNIKIIVSVYKDECIYENKCYNIINCIKNYNNVIKKVIIVTVRVIQNNFIQFYNYTSYSLNIQ